jgi:STE24 endopeptidase
MAIWLVGAEQFQRASAPAKIPPHSSIPIFIGGYLALVAMVALWSRLLSRRALRPDFRGTFRRFNQINHLIRWLIPAWMAVDVFRGGAWTQTVMRTFGSHFELQGMTIGIAPAMFTWVALWWAEYPAERAMREQNILDELMNDMPVHEPPPLRRMLITNIRQQLLPIVIPILLITLFRDLLLLARVGTSFGELMMVPAAGLVYLISPFLLIWLFNARPLPDSPLRKRLEAICTRCGLRYRNIMLWQTDYSMANAAVVGLLPGWRYVLLSDRLLETMTDREIEAVFAHELGHIVHNHMAWLVVFVATMVLASLGPGQMVEDWVRDHYPRLLRNYALGVTWAGLVVAATIILLGYLSRRLERQADVFAARMMEIDWGSLTTQPAVSSTTPVPHSHVGEKGSAIFAAALQRVAYVNNIPMRARGLFHPSIARRLRYLDELSRDPAQTNHFDRVMSHIYAALILVLMTCGTLAAAMLTRYPI